MRTQYCITLVFTARQDKALKLGQMRSLVNWVQETMDNATFTEEMGFPSTELICTADIDGDADERSEP